MGNMPRNYTDEWGNQFIYEEHFDGGIVETVIYPDGTSSASMYDVQ